MQVQAYRFGMRRLENAVANGQSYKRTLGGPRPNLSFLVGFVLAALVLAGFAVYALISPSPSIGDAKVLVDGDNGGSYVLRGKTLHPALNYASALLAAGNTTDSSSGDAGTAKPKVGVVDADTLASLPKGRTLGIPGAPNQVPDGSELVADTWTVCDTSTLDSAKAPTQTPTVSTTVVLGQAPGRSPNANLGALVSPDKGASVYLLAYGRSQRVNLQDRAVTVALNSSAVTPRPISAGLLAAIPPGPMLAPPDIPTPGAPSPIDLGPGISVASVFRVEYAQSYSDFVVLATGVEQISPLLSDLIRAQYPNNNATIPRVSLANLRKAPLVDTIDITRYPPAQPAFSTLAQDPLICLGWDGGKLASSYSVYPTSTSPVPAGAAAVPTAGGTPGVANAVYIAPGHGEVFGQVLTGTQKPATGTKFLVTDQGVKYPVVSQAALSLLGLASSPIRGASQALLALLPTGATLDPAAAAKYTDPASGR